MTKIVDIGANGQLGTDLVEILLVPVPVARKSDLAVLAREGAMGWR
jgi:hypothetical protein